MGLQAIQRGKQARREVAEKAAALQAAIKEADDAQAAAEEEVDIPDDAETNAAATKLQAIQRGKLARRQVAEKAAALQAAIEEVDAAQEEIEAVKVAMEEVAVADEQIDIPDDEETNAAATKLQAIQRGKNARKEVEAKKAAAGS